MPFTLAHPAAAAPLWYIARRRLVLSALICGCMAPDFSYFVVLAARKTVMHEPAGVVAIGLPVSLVLLWCFHRVVRVPLLRLMPEPVAARFVSVPEFRFLPGSRLALICVSVVVGAFSHLAWDSFTHRHGWSVERLAALQYTPLTWRGEGIGVYKVLQHGSGILGLAFLAWWGWRWYRRAPIVPPAFPPLTPRVRNIVLAVFLASGVAMSLTGMVLAQSTGSAAYATSAFVSGVVGFVSGLATSVFVYGLALTLSRQ